MADDGDEDVMDESELDETALDFPDGRFVTHPYDGLPGLRVGAEMPPPGNDKSRL